MTCIWIHYARPRPHWYTLESSEKAALKAQWAKVAATSREQGGHCDGVYEIRGQSDFSTVEIWRFETPDGAFTHWRELTQSAYAEWNAFANNIGFRALNQD